MINQIYFQRHKNMNNIIYQYIARPNFAKIIINILQQENINNCNILESNIYLPGPDLSARWHNIVCAVVMKDTAQNEINVYTLAVAQCATEKKLKFI